MRREDRQAALCLFRRNRSVLLVEVIDPLTGGRLHRPPGGGLEEGETPEEAVRREVREELSIVLEHVEPLCAVDHVWFFNGREVHERAHLFLADAACDPRLARGETLELLEANGRRFRTVWRSVETEEGAPPTSPAMLPLLLERILD